MQIERSGDCAGYAWNVRWNQGGKKDALKVSFTKNSSCKCVINMFVLNLQQQQQQQQKIVANTLAGNSASISTQSVTSGGVFFKPILDNMLRTFHKVPQVNTPFDFC